MTDRDLSSPARAGQRGRSPELDFAEAAWAAAARRPPRRRRRPVGTASARSPRRGSPSPPCSWVARPTPRPRRAVSSTTHGGRGTLPDGTAYAVMPPGGQGGAAARLRRRAALHDRRRGRRRGRSRRLARRTRSWRSTCGPTGERFHPVLVTGDGSQIAGRRRRPRLDQRRERQRGHAARLRGPWAGAGATSSSRNATTCSGSTPRPVPRSPTRVPSQHVRVGRLDRRRQPDRRPDADARLDDRPARRPDAPRPVAAGVATRAVPAVRHRRTAGSLRVTATTGRGALGEASARVHGPVTDSCGARPLNTEDWAATGAFFDQNLTSPVIRRGFGPIYQGLVAVEPSSAASAQLLLAPENPDGQTGRFKGCCTVLGWADAQTVLFQSVGSHGRWILAWNDDHRRGLRGLPDHHRRLRTTRPPPIALNVGGALAPPD